MPRHFHASDIYWRTRPLFSLDFFVCFTPPLAPCSVKQSLESAKAEATLTYLPQAMSSPSLPKYASTKAIDAAALDDTKSSFSSLGKDESKSHHRRGRRGHKHRFSLHRTHSTASSSSSSSSSSDSSSASSIKSDSSAASHQKLRALKYKLKDWKKEVKVHKKAVKRDVKAKVKGSKGGRKPKKGDGLDDGAVSVIHLEGRDELLERQESGVVGKK